MPPTNSRLSSHRWRVPGQQLLGDGVDQCDAGALLAGNLLTGVHDDELLHVVGSTSRWTPMAPLTPMPWVMLLTKPESTALSSRRAPRATRGRAVDADEPAADVDGAVRRHHLSRARVRVRREAAHRRPGGHVEPGDALVGHTVDGAERRRRRRAWCRPGSTATELMSASPKSGLNAGVHETGGQAVRRQPGLRGRSWCCRAAGSGSR